MRIAVTTAIFGDYDTIRPGGYFAPGVPYILFTDNPKLQFEGWATRVVENFNNLSPVRRARAVKILMHQMLPDTEYTVWHGANIVLLKHPIAALGEWLGTQELAAFSHPHRQCVYEEAKTCKMMGKGKPSEMDAQMEAYRNEGYPSNNGLATAWFLIRRHGTWVDEFCEQWWREVQTYSYRDQLSFNYVLWKMGRDYKPIPGDLLRHEDFEYYQHERWQDEH